MNTLEASPMTIHVQRLPIRLESDDRRVITRPFLMGAARVRSLLERIDKIDEGEIPLLLTGVRAGYHDRHDDLDHQFREHYKDALLMTGWHDGWSEDRKLLAGSFLTMEYAIDSAALFNPSIVPHPDQSGVAPGALKFVMSLRATGEGHVSSIVFRTGVITPAGQVEMDAYPKKLHRSRVAPDRYYVKELFQQKLKEMGLRGTTTDAVLADLPDPFTLTNLTSAIDAARPNFGDAHHQANLNLRSALWQAQSNYHISLPPKAAISELVIFPMSEEESRGIEDLRLVRFVDNDQSVTYYGTYTAYNGFRTIPMMISTRDFRKIEIHSLNGGAALNKGMALFPRRINGKYCMCSRIDGENLFISYSDTVHFWTTAERLTTPVFPWELMQIGNCGSPIETPQGWLLLTHGVGPMRTYAIGAMLLDLDNPLKIRGHLRQPFLIASNEEREGYVPNVVYTCGSLPHAGQLYIPFALADKSTGLAVVNLAELLESLVKSG